jgi:hypothetical protein
MNVLVQYLKKSYYNIKRKFVVGLLSMEPKQLLDSVAVPSAPVQVPSQRPLAPRVTYDFKPRCIAFHTNMLPRF